MELLPVFEMLGNQGALLMLDEVRPLAEYPGAHSFAADDEAFAFLKDCFQEIAAAFDSKYFHAGLDESWDLGFGKSEELVKRLGRGPAHAGHYLRINELLKSHGKKMIMYGDIILKYPEILDLIPKDIVLMDWQYEPMDHYPTVDVLGSKGFPIIVLPGMSNWDRIFPDMSKAMINIRNFTLDCYRQPQPLGSITSTWGDNGSKNLRELLYYGYAYGRKSLGRRNRPTYRAFPTGSSRCRTGQGRDPTSRRFTRYWKSGRGGFRCSIISGIRFCPRMADRTQHKSCIASMKMRGRRRSCAICSTRSRRGAREMSTDFPRLRSDARTLRRQPTTGRGSERLCGRRAVAGRARGHEEDLARSH